MAELFDSKYFRGQGKLFVADRDPTTGAPMGLTFLGDISQAALKPSVSRKEVIENVSGSSGIGATWINNSKFNLSIGMRSIRRDHLAAALQGTMTQKVGASVTGESAKAYKGKFVVLAHNKVSAVAVTGPGGTPTYSAGTDYTVDAATGMIEIITAGTIADGASILINYTYAAQSHAQAKPSNIDKYFVFAGKNTADNDKQVRVEIFKVKLDPTVWDMISDDAAVAELTGVVQQDTLRASGDQFFTWKIED